MRIVVILMIISSPLYCQQKDSVAHRSVHGITLKWSPLHLLNRYPTFQIALEHRIGRQFTLQWDGGYVLDYNDETVSNRFDKAGFKAKLDVRYYWFSRRVSFFMAPEFYYNYVDYKKTGTFGIGCESGLCDYYQYTTYTMRYREPGLNFKFGFFHQIGKHFCIEYHAGLSQRFIRYTSQGAPAESKLFSEDEEWFSNSENSRNTLSPTTSFRVGYIF